MMQELPWISGPPSRLLLATDLGARCDRALDRAAQLATEWQAGFVVVNVRETPQDPDQVLRWACGESDATDVLLARRQLQRDLYGLDISADIHVVSGDAPDCIRAVTAKTGCGLVVTGMARNEVFGRFLVGSTVQNLARGLSVPLLVVRTRARGAYQRIIVATDFSDSSRHALQAALRYFPGRKLVLYHAHTVPLADNLPPSVISAASQRIEKRECAEFLAACDLTDEERSRLQVVIEAGPVETALACHVRKQEAELVVVGSHGSSGLMNILLGSTSARLLEWLPCDTMVVREPRAAT